MRKGLLLAAALYPVAVHLAIVAHASAVAVALLLTMTGLHLFLHRPNLRHSPWAWTYIAVAVAGVISLTLGKAGALYLPPVLINLVLTILFARTLRAGRTPLIERFMRLEYAGTPPPALCRYGRQLTFLWSGFFAASTLTAIALAAFTPLALWSLWVNILNFVLIALIYAAQYAYLYWRYRKYELHSPWNWLRVLVRLRTDDPLHPFYTELRAR